MSDPTRFDAAAKEQALRAEAAAWDTSRPGAAAEGDVPVVDVGPWISTGDPDALAEAAAALRLASEEVGFHQLLGHGLPASQTNAVLDAARRFHAQPIAAKRAVLMDRPDWPLAGVGYLPVGNRKLPRRDRGNRNEAFVFKRDHGIGFDHNQWPDERHLRGFRRVVEDYAVTMEDLARRLLPVYAVALDLPPHFFAPAFARPYWRLRLTRYPPADPGGEPGHGIEPHVDTTFFTLLLADGPGLTIYSHRREEWITVPVVPGALVVNSGELLRQWSNDRFLSTRHFADNPAPSDRYAVPFFFNADADHVMECLPSCHGPGNPPRYPPVSYRQSQAAVQGE